MNYYRLVCGIGLGAGLAVAPARAQNPIVINEIHYNPDVRTERVEFIELYNRGTNVVNLSGWHFSAGIAYTFPAETIVTQGGYVVVAKQPSALVSKWSFTGALGPYTNDLSAQGETLTLCDATGDEADSVTYQLGFPWPTVGDPPSTNAVDVGKGFSIELIHPLLDNDLGGSWRCSSNSASRGPTPGRQNVVYATNAPPQTRQVQHEPEQPKTGQPVKITARVTDPDGVRGVLLEYQVVQPGAYVELLSPAYTNPATWNSVAMNDSGTNGDLVAGDGLYTVEIPASVQVHRRLVRYRITVTDTPGASVRVPYADDPQPNFAYFVYDEVPAWQGAIQPGVGGANGTVVTVSSNEMARLPVYHLIATKAAVESSTWFTRYAFNQANDLGIRSEYQWWGTLVYDGKVYDHIRYRPRGGVWRYSMCKNMWKFDMNRGHDFEARDNWGRKFQTGWTKVNFGANIQQGNYEHRGEQGMFESLGFRMFQIAGVPSPHTVYVTFRVIDEVAESYPNNQYEGDFWGMYLVIEDMGGRFLAEHGLPDGNLYKIDWGGTGFLDNGGPNGPTNGSDLAYIRANFNSASDQWWRTNWNLAEYYSYQAIIQAIHHYDINGGKNYFYYHNPDTGLWDVFPWDLDLSWAHNMYNTGWGGLTELTPRILTGATSVAGTGAQSGTSNLQLGGGRPALEKEFKNRVREIRDLFFNADQAWQMIDEHARLLRGTNAPNILDADRDMWDYNPKMTNSLYTDQPSSKAGVGRFYQFPLESGTNANLRGSFSATVQISKNYVRIRSEHLDALAADPLIPNRPTLTYVGPTNFPINRLMFQSGSFSTPSTTNGFGAMVWRIAEVSDTNTLPVLANEPIKYEIETLWTSGPLPTFNADFTYLPEPLRVGRRYRARVQHTDNYGRNSNWSLPVEFVVGPPDNSAVLQSYLRLTELMYHPLPGGYEFVELQNTSSNLTLDLAAVRFTQGFEFTFGTGVTLPPGGRLLVANAPTNNNFAAFRAFYGLDTNVLVVGPFASGALNNAGERVVLRTAAGGMDILDFNYSDGRAWPLAAAGAGHSLVFDERNLLVESGSAASYGANWRASAYLGGSPGRAESLLAPSLLINEIATHTLYNDPAHPEFDSNDWIELHNPTDTNLPLGPNWFLSDNAANLTRWMIPSNTVVPAHGFVSFDEVTGFHPATNVGFGLSLLGEQLFLSYLPGGGQDRIVDAVDFKAQAAGTSWGRYPDGSVYWQTLAPTTRGTNNVAPGLHAVISEIYFHPPDLAGTNDNTQDEFIELFNPTLQTVNLHLATAEQEVPWRLDGGVSYTFPTNLILPPGGYLLVVNFDPTNFVQLETFRAVVGLTDTNIPIVGPYGGQLANDSERVALEYAIQGPAPDFAPGWVIVDEVIYADRTPWPCGADGTGNSLQRVDASRPGSDYANWMGQVPSPGAPRVPLPAGVPEIIAQPQSQLIPTNGSVAFNVELCGLPPYDYQWFFNNTPIAAATNPTVTLNQLQLTDTGYYSVRVANAAGVITSVLAALVVQLPPVTVLVPPQSQVATGYTTVYFRVTTDGTPPFQYQWQFQGNDIPDATNAVLELKNVQRQNAGDYSVRVANSAGTVTSPRASLTVNMPPFILTPPAAQTVVKGQNAIFSSQATGDGTLSYQWLFNGVALTGATSISLTLTNVQPEQAGDYVLLVTNSFGQAASQPVTLTVLVRPFITMQPQPVSQTVPVGGTASFTISAGGTLPMSYRWRQGSKNLTNIIVYSNTCTYTLYDVKTNDAGNYNCAITNIAGPNQGGISANAALIVLWPPVITNQPQSQTVALGANVTLAVGAAGSPPLSYQWWFQQTNLLAGATNTTLTLTNLQTRDLGDYTVVVSNPAAAATSDVASLMMPGFLVITNPPASQTVVAGAPANFSVGVKGDGPFQYQWFFKGTPLAAATNVLLTLTNVQAPNAGSYEVRVANGLSAVTSSPATLTVDLSIRVKSARRETNGFRLLLEGPAGINYLIGVSTNIKTWTLLSTNAAPDGTVDFLDLQAFGSRARYYRPTPAP